MDRGFTLSRSEREAEGRPKPLELAVAAERPPRRGRRRGEVTPRRARRELPRGRCLPDQTRRRRRSRRPAAWLLPPPPRRVPLAVTGTRSATQTGPPAAKRARLSRGRRPRRGRALGTGRRREPRLPGWKFRARLPAQTRPCARPRGAPPGRRCPSDRDCRHSIPGPAFACGCSRSRMMARYRDPFMSGDRGTVGGRSGTPVRSARGPKRAAAAPRSSRRVWSHPSAEDPAFVGTSTIVRSWDRARATTSARAAPRGAGSDPAPR